MQLQPLALCTLVVLAFVVFATCSTVPKAGDGNVVQVHAVFRHGERTPQDTYPTDPHITQTFYPEGWGQLTLNGKRQALAQGRWLRERYGKLVGDLYLPKVVETISTDVDRSIMSASLVLAGIFPPSPIQQLEDGLGWQPAPIHTTPLPLDDLLLVRIPCPKYHEEKKRVLALAPNTELLENNAELLKQLSEITGDPIKTLDDVQSLYSTLVAEERYNLTLPEWTHGIYPERLVNMTSYSFAINVQTELMRRLKAGPLLNRMFGQMKSRSEGKDTKRILLYSGHDSTVANIIGAFGHLRSPYIPGYNALVIIELVEPEPGKYAVRVFRRSEEHREPELLRLEGCDAECPFADFARLTEPVRPVDWKAECVPDDPNFKAPTPPPP